jgi:hypothetical protein
MGLTFEGILQELERKDEIPPASSYRLFRLTMLDGSVLTSEPQYGRPLDYLSGHEDDRHIISPACTFERDSLDILHAVKRHHSGPAGLKRLRRAYVTKHHPDRIRDATKLLRATEVLSRVNAAIDDLEQGRS